MVRQRTSASRAASALHVSQVRWKDELGTHPH
jgi:hypothetical protein